MNLAMDVGLMLQGVIAGLVLWAIKGIAQINGSVRELSEWRKNHEKQDDERHEELKEQLAALRGPL